MDVVTVCAAYHHFSDTAGFAKEAKRVLKPSGKIYIADVYLPPVLRFFINPFVPLSGAGDVKFYSPKEIAGNLEQYGFKTLEIKIFGHVQIVVAQKP